MSFTRYMLANWRIAFVPKVGAKYRERNRGPFEGGSIITPLELRSGYVRYRVDLEAGHSYEMITTFGVFASMNQEGYKSIVLTSREANGKALTVDQLIDEHHRMATLLREIRDRSDDHAAASRADKLLAALGEVLPTSGIRLVEGGA